MMADRPIYSERTWAPAWFWVLLWAACLVGAGALAYGVYSQAILGQPFGNEPGPTWVLAGASAFLFLLPVVLTLTSGRLDVEVWEDHLFVGFGPVRMLKKTMTYDEIERAESITYRPIRDFGGWGVRFRPGKTAWSVGGNKAVKISLTNEKIFYVGSRFPHRLAERIQMAQAKRRQQAAQTRS